MRSSRTCWGRGFLPASRGIAPWPPSSRTGAPVRFALFAEEGFASDTLTCVANTRGISVADLNKELGRQAAAISNGYGDLKEKTFRIAHMGDTQEWEIRGLLATIDRILKLT
jgi:aspartate aminotransferase-like enzyme